MRSAIEHAQDPIPPPDSSTFPAVPAFRISPQVTPGYVCSNGDLIFDGIGRRAPRAENAAGLGGEPAPVDDTGGHGEVAGALGQTATQSLMGGPSHCGVRGARLKVTIHSYAVTANWASKFAVCRVGVLLVHTAASMS